MTQHEQLLMMGVLVHLKTHRSTRYVCAQCRKPMLTVHGGYTSNSLAHGGWHD